MESLRDKLFGGAKTLRDKLAESITGSYEVKKLNEDTNYVTEKPNIFERIGGKQAESYPVKRQEPIPMMNKPDPMKQPILQSFDTSPRGKIINPRKESLFNKLRAGVEDFFDGEDQQASVVGSLPLSAKKIDAEDEAPRGWNVERKADGLYTWPKGAKKINAEDEAPEGSNVERINGELITWPKNGKEKKTEYFRKGILYNENRGAIAAGKNPYESVGPTGDIGKYQASPATIASWSKPWLGKKYTAEEFKKDPDAQERFFNEFIRVKDKYDVSNEDAAIMWHRGWGVLGYKGSFEEKKKRLQEYLDSIRDDELSQNYLNSFKQGIQDS